MHLLGFGEGKQPFLCLPLPFLGAGQICQNQYLAIGYSLPHRALPRVVQEHNDEVVLKVVRSLNHCLYLLFA
jgi:hypothetical protein